MASCKPSKLLSEVRSVSPADRDRAIITPSPWLLRRPGRQSRLRLFCFPYAGGSAVGFLAWQAALAPEIEVCAMQLPGRGPRLAEPPIDRFPELIRQLVPVIHAHADLPFAFFGHSLGGLVAFELTRTLRRRKLALPQHLFVSATNPPDWRATVRRWHELDDAGLIAALRDLNGTPTSALQNPELMALTLPALRADFGLLADYRYQAEAPLALPLTVLAGREDSHVFAPGLTDWQEETAATFRLCQFPGDHFFLHAQSEPITRLIKAALLDEPPGVA